MASETKESLDALDPLARFSILSLFPPTLGVLKTATQPSDSDQDLDSIHDHVKSLVSQSPKKLLNQAKAVMEENKQLNINVPNNAAQDNSELILAADNNPKKRRVGLNRKRPRFSLKPDLSQPSVNLEPSFDIDNYEDPDEFFAAYESFEHIKKAIQKHAGTSQNDNVHFTSSQEGRTRRPGLLGRSYKNHFIESDILPQELLNQAKAVMEENKQLNINVPSNAAQDNSELIVAADNNPKKRRPGLDLKRPHFSLKPDLSQPSVNLDPSFDIDKYEDPNEFFAAYERFEHIKKAIQKHTGTSQNDNVHFTSSQEGRTRRPGLLGRSYKHHFIEPDIQELLAKNTNAPSSADLQESVELYIPSKERDATGSEKEVDTELNELSSKKKHLQMEDFSIEPLCLPEMVSTKASIGNTIKPRRALSDIQNLSKGVLHSSDAKLSGTLSSRGYLSSKNRPKSPHAQIAMLKKRLFNANTSVDPFSSIYVDEVDAHSEDVNMSSKTCVLGKVKSPITIADYNAPAEVGTSGASLEHSVHAHDDTGSRSFNQEHSRGAGSIHINDDPTDTISGFDIDQTVRDDDMNIADSSLGQEEAVIPIEPDPNMENLNSKENTITTDLEEPPVCSTIQEQPKDGSSKAADSAPEQQVEEPTKSLPNGKSKRKLGTRKSNKRKAPPTDENPEDTSNPVTVDCENAETTNASPEEPLEEAPREIANEESKLEQRMKFDSSRWQSLSGGGTKWEKCKLKKGNNESEKVVRRSTRIRSRPLAYWKGERFLYGRIHQSLATVIGVKSFDSPGDDGISSLKVKSVVDDKFKDLVEFAGLH